MALTEVHFEVYRKLDAREGWSLFELAGDRDSALEIAARDFATARPFAVQVVKEVYEPESGVFTDIVIFERARAVKKPAVRVAVDDVVKGSCETAADLFGEPARAALAQCLKDYLAKKRLTVTELIHRADCLTALEAAGTIYQHTVQKIAVAQAASTGTPVQSLVRHLNRLATEAMHRVYRDARRGYFPKTDAAGFAALCIGLDRHPEGTYRLNGALAAYLAPFGSWLDKLNALLSIVPEGAMDEPGSGLLLGALDAIAAELLATPDAVALIAGPAADIAAALDCLATVIGGEPAGTQAARQLASLFKARLFPLSRVALGRRILRELKRPKRLCPHSLPAELAVSRALANRLVQVDGAFLPHDDLLAAFALRSSRLIAADALAEQFSQMPAPDDRAAFLLQMGENIVGVENRQRLAASLRQILNGLPFEQHLQNGAKPVLQRLKRIAELQARIAKSGFDAREKDEFAERLDRLAATIESGSRVLQSLCDSLPGPVERATALLRLCRHGVLPEGRVLATARSLVRGILARPDFVADYLAASESRPAMIQELTSLLQAAGIGRDVLKAPRAA